MIDNLVGPMAQNGEQLEGILNESKDPLPIQVIREGHIRLHIMLQNRANQTRSIHRGS